MLISVCKYSLSARASQAMPTKLTNVKIALLDFNLQKHKLQMGVSVVVTDTKQVAEIRQREMVCISIHIHSLPSTTHHVLPFRSSGYHQGEDNEDSRRRFLSIPFHTYIMVLFLFFFPSIQ